MADLQKTRKQKDKVELQLSGEDESGSGKDKGEPVDGDTKAFKTPNKEHKKWSIVSLMFRGCTPLMPLT